MNEAKIPVDPTTLPIVHTLSFFDGKALEVGNLILKDHLALINQPEVPGGLACFRP